MLCESEEQENWRKANELNTTQSGYTLAIYAKEAIFYSLESALLEILFISLTVEHSLEDKLLESCESTRIMIKIEAFVTGMSSK